MSKFAKELLLGIGMIIAGVAISIASEYFLFYGLIIAGIFIVILSFVHLSQSRRKKPDNNTDGAVIKKFYPTDKPQEKVRFLETLDAQEALDKPKQVSIICPRKDQSSTVKLNGVEVGRVTPETPLMFAVTKKNNVVSISEQYEGICFFHVSNSEGIGELKIGIGMQSIAVKTVPGTGLTEGIIEARSI